MNYQSDKPIINKKILTDYSGTFKIMPTLTKTYSKDGKILYQILVSVWTDKGEMAYKKNVSFKGKNGNDSISPRKMEEVIDNCLVEIRKIVSGSRILKNKKTHTKGKSFYKSFELKGDKETRKVYEDDTKELNLD